MGFVEYLDSNEWVYALIAVAGLVIVAGICVLAVCVCWYCCRYRQQRYYVTLSDGEDTVSYGSLVIREEEEARLAREARTNQTARPSVQSGSGVSGPREVGLNEAWRQRREREMSKEREIAVLACQFYVRNTKRYTLQRTLEDIGSRLHKYWFLGLPIPSPPDPRYHLLTLSPGAKHCSINLQGGDMETLNALLAVLKHPYLLPITEVDCIAEKGLVLVVQPFCSKGSLKDIIYKAQPLADWTDKYSTRRRGLPLNSIAFYGLQTLEALTFLYKKGFPQIGHIQSGNVLIEEEGGVCRLSGYENTLLGYRTRQYKMFAEHPGSIDPLMFGHLLFEMACGYELTTMLPRQQDYQAVPYPTLLEVLEFIFSSDGGGFPSIQQIRVLPFFQQTELSEHTVDSVHLSSEMKLLLRQVRRTRSAEQPKSSQSRRTSAAAGPSDTKQTVPTAKPAVPPKKPHLMSLKGPPHPSRHAPQRAKAPPPSSQVSKPRPPLKGSGHSRKELLRDIHKGTRLKSSTTDDRSAPHLK